MADHAEPKGPGPFRSKRKEPDYNPDKERHADHKYVILDAVDGKRTGIQVGNKRIPMKKGRAIISDEGLAREIQREHRYDLTVTRMRTTKPSDSGHKYYFGQMPQMPWHDAAELEARKARNAEKQKANNPKQSEPQDKQAA